MISQVGQNVTSEPEAQSVGLPTAPAEDSNSKARKCARMNEPPPNQREPLKATACLTSTDTAFGCPRDFLDNRFVYTVISPRARGLSIGVNLNPDKLCNFDCVYCEVNRAEPPRERNLDLDVMALELERTLELVQSGRIRERANYGLLPEELIKLRHVALSGDGEPTLCPNFAEALETVVHVRARGRFPFFKLVLITNASSLDRIDVVQGLRLFTSRDEIWAKLDAGTQEYMDLVNKPDCGIE
jgi:wyosine [tRNA(Phe)-imidazoG37] synthetase (radical SAM superfamily)